MTDHPITPPPELVEQWAHEAGKGWRGNGTYEQDIATQAARWGSDQELEACCGLLRQQGFDVVDDLCAARRPKPPSLKELALDQLKSLEVAFLVTHGGDAKTESIRRALEQLDA